MRISQRNQRIHLHLLILSVCKFHPHVNDLSRVSKTNQSELFPLKIPNAPLHEAALLHNPKPLLLPGSFHCSSLCVERLPGVDVFRLLFCGDRINRPFRSFTQFGAPSPSLIGVLCPSLLTWVLICLQSGVGELKKKNPFSCDSSSPGWLQKGNKRRTLVQCVCWRRRRREKETCGSGSKTGCH